MEKTLESCGLPPAALVTGAARRLGAAFCRVLAAAGYDIALHARRVSPEAMALAEEIRTCGNACEIFPADLADGEACEGLVAQVLARFPGLRLLVNNASVFRRAPIAESGWELFSESFSVNLRAPFVLTRDFAGLVGSGHVINLLDSKIARGGSRYAAYTLAKQALAAFTEMAAREFAPSVRVNGLAPGFALLPEGAPEGYEAELLARIPLGRGSGPDELCEALLFLERSPGITGQILYVDGGWHL